MIIIQDKQGQSISTAMMAMVYTKVKENYAECFYR
jgi:hypothetical protein